MVLSYLDGALSNALAFSNRSTTTTNSTVDRYNLYTSSAGMAAHEFASGAGDHQHYDKFGFRESNPISYYAGDLFPGSGMANTSVRTHMGPGEAGGTGSVVDEQGIECLSLDSVVQPHVSKLASAD